jgi:hypothetical protein
MASRQAKADHWTANSVGGHEKLHSKPVAPVANRVMTHVYNAPGQQVFDVAATERIFDVQHHRQVDDLGRSG